MSKALQLQYFSFLGVVFLVSLAPCLANMGSLAKIILPSSIAPFTRERTELS